MMIRLVAPVVNNTHKRVVMPAGTEVDVLIKTGDGWLVRDDNYQVWFVPEGFAGEMEE